MRGSTTEGKRVQLPFEAVENITKPLASVSKMIDAGHAVLYHPSGSAIFNLQDARNRELKGVLEKVVTNKKNAAIPLTRENDVYTFELAIDVAASREANTTQSQPGSGGEQGFGRPR